MKTFVLRQLGNIINKLNAFCAQNSTQDGNYQFGTGKNVKQFEFVIQNKIIFASISRKETLSPQIYLVPKIIFKPRFYNPIFF